MRDFFLRCSDSLGVARFHAVVTIVAFHALTLVALVATPYNLVDQIVTGDTIQMVYSATFLALVLVGEFLFFWLRSIRVTRVAMACAVVVLLAGEVMMGAADRGTGLLYFIAGFSLIYFIFGFKGGVTFILTFLVFGVGSLLVLNYHPPSILADPLIRERMAFILATGSILGLCAVGFQHYLVRDLTRLAYQDSTTGLHNRAWLLEWMDQRIQVHLKHPRPFTILAIKLRSFSILNATHGTVQTDRILAQCANRLRALVGTDDAVGRFSGTHFLVLSSEVDHLRLQRMGEAILRHLERPYLLEKGEATVNFNVGITTWPRDGEKIQHLLSSIMALLATSTPGNDRILFHDSEVFRREQEHFALANDLRKALAKQELTLVYHPTINLATGACEGAEVLLRWHHPTLGNVSPATFIPVAEESGQIEGITQWVLGQTMGELRHIKAALGSHFDLLIHAVNLSPLDFLHKRLDLQLAHLVDTAGLTPRCLELEITEGVLMGDNRVVRQLLDSFIRQGYRLAIDDFGTGYSSLSYLHTIQAHTIKIDQSFIRRLHGPEDSRPIVSAIIAMARALGIDTTAEGVETAEQAEWLAAAGCTRAQGWYWSHPMSLASYLDWLKNCPTLSTPRTSTVPLS